MKKPEFPRAVGFKAWSIIVFFLLLLIGAFLYFVFPSLQLTILAIEGFITLGFTFAQSFGGLGGTSKDWKLAGNVVIFYISLPLYLLVTKVLMRVSRVVILVLVILGALFAGFHDPLLNRLFPPTSISPAPPQPLIFSQNTANGDIGISDGSYAFDVEARNNQKLTGSRSGDLKKNAAEAFKEKNYQGAVELWKSALVGVNSNDAEALIYLEDLRVISSNIPYVTFIVVTQLTGSHEEYTIGRGDLQGYYLAQKEFNSGNHPFLIRLLIANIGDEEQYARAITERIISAYKQDPSIKGVVGWPERSNGINDMIQSICQTNIPVMTVSANDIANENYCSYNFSVAPSLDFQVLTASKYIKSVLKKKRVSIIYDPANDYSQSLYNRFVHYFPDKALGTSIIDRESYSIYNSNSLPGLIRATLRGRPDLIYFAGYPTDLNAVLESLNTFQPSGGVDIMAANILYQSPQFPDAQQIGNVGIYFTAFAYPDEWHTLLQPEPLFIKEYVNAYNTINAPPGTYGYNRANDTVMIAYDALKTLTTASANFNDHQFSLQQLQNAVMQSNYQGVTGLIRYQRGSTNSKPVVVIQFTKQEHNTFKGVNGCYTADQRGCYDIQTEGKA